MTMGDQLLVMDVESLDTVETSVLSYPRFATLAELVDIKRHFVGPHRSSLD